MISQKPELSRSRQRFVIEKHVLECPEMPDLCRLDCERQKQHPAPKTLRGDWQQLVTTEEFERGLEILARRNQHRSVRRKQEYLLQGSDQKEVLRNVVERVVVTAEKPW